MERNGRFDEFFARERIWARQEKEEMQEKDEHEADDEDATSLFRR